MLPEMAHAMASVEGRASLPETGMPQTPVMSERMVSLLGALFVVIGPMSMALYTPAMPEIVKAFGGPLDVAEVAQAFGSGCSNRNSRRVSPAKNYERVML